MTTKEWLMRGWEINKEINALLEEKERAFSRACSVTAPTDREHVTTTRRNTFEEKTVRYADYEKRLTVELMSCIKLSRKFCLPLSG